MFLAFGLLFGAAAQSDDVAAILKRADSVRLPESEAKIEVRLRLYENDVVEKERNFTVYTRPGRRSLVLFRSAGEAGQKVLMLDNDFWMFMPNTKRPFRITPMQKLLGDASTGDVATLTWSEDYAGKVITKALRGAPCPDGRLCQQLELHSSRAGTTYERIELWLDQSDVPLFARLYLASGKLAKEATYRLGDSGGRRRIMAMTLQDRISGNRRTEIEYVSISAATIPDKYYNPAFLLRENVK